MEKYKTIEGFPNYKISNLGNVKNIKTNRILKQDYNRKYPSVLLWVNKTRYHKSIHRLIANAFIPNPEKHPVVNHINEIKTDNTLDNLEWCTHSYNQIYSKKEKISKKRILHLISNNSSLNKKDILQLIIDNCK